MRLFCCPDSALHWLVLYCCSACQEGVRSSHSWDDTEFASRSSVEWRGSHPWTITCSIGVQSFYVRQCSSVAKMRMAPQKCNIYAKFCNEHDPWWQWQLTVITTWHDWRPLLQLMLDFAPTLRFLWSYIFCTLQKPLGWTCKCKLYTILYKPKSPVLYVHACKKITYAR